MRFEELEARMRAFESARDPCALPGVYLVARLDGRSFTRLTKELLDLERPYDERFRDAVIHSIEHVMNCGLGAAFAYTQSDEVSLLFAPGCASFSRNIRKWTSVLAGETSAAFSLRIGQPAAFDCRIIELPSLELVVDYFRWRNEDAHRNALNSWCYWTLRKQGVSAKDATDTLSGLSISEKNELLFSKSINFNDLPLWQRRGIAVTWEEYDKPAVNPTTGAAITARRRRLCVDMELPMRDQFSSLIREKIAAAC